MVSRQNSMLRIVAAEAAKRGLARDARKNLRLMQRLRKPLPQRQMQKSPNKFVGKMTLAQSIENSF